MANIVKKYNLGIAIKSKNELLKQLQTYIENFDEVKFLCGCEKFKEDVLNEQIAASDVINDFVKNKNRILI